MLRNHRWYVTLSTNSEWMFEFLFDPSRHKVRTKDRDTHMAFATKDCAVTFYRKHQYSLQLRKLQTVFGRPIRINEWRKGSRIQWAQQMQH